MKKTNTLNRYFSLLIIICFTSCNVSSSISYNVGSDERFIRPNFENSLKEDDSFNDLLYLNADLNDNENYQLIHVEMCNDKSFIIVAHFLGKKRFLRKYKSNLIKFEIHNYNFPEAKKYVLKDVIFDPSENQSKQELNLKIVLEKNPDKLADTIQTIDLKKFKVLKKNTYFNFHLFENGAEFVHCNLKPKDSIDNPKSIGDHICKIKASY